MDNGTATYMYDGVGCWMKKTVGNISTFYFYGPGGIISEFSTDTTISTATTGGNNDKTAIPNVGPSGHGRPADRREWPNSGKQPHATVWGIAKHGTLGIYADRNWVVINGDWGADNGRQDGNKIYCQH